MTICESFLHIKGSIKLFYVNFTIECYLRLRWKETGYFLRSWLATIRGTMTGEDPSGQSKPNYTRMPVPFCPHIDARKHKTVMMLCRKKLN